MGDLSEALLALMNVVLIPVLQMIIDLLQCLIRVSAHALIASWTHYRLIVLTELYPFPQVPRCMCTLDSLHVKIANTLVDHETVFRQAIK